MNEKEQIELMNNMADNLPTLRKRLDLSQEELAKLVGVSRSTIVNIENKKRIMAWNTFLSLILIFTKNKETDRLLTVMNVYTDELNDMIKNRRYTKRENKINEQETRKTSAMGKRIIE